MTRPRLRLLLLSVGVLLPYVVRLPWGLDWVLQYAHADAPAHLFLHGLNALVWAPLIALTWLYRDMRWIWLPAVVGLGILAWGHASLDLAADAQAAVALLVLPILALPPMLLAAVIAWWQDARHAKKSA